MGGEEQRLRESMQWRGCCTCGARNCGQQRIQPKTELWSNELWKKEPVMRSAGAVNQEREVANEWKVQEARRRMGVGLRGCK